MTLDVMRQLQAAVGDQTALYGLICGPLTLASHLRGTVLFMDTFERPDFLVALLDYCTRVVQRMAALHIEAGMDVIAVVDPLVSQIGPKHFQQLMHTPLSTLFNDLRAQGVPSSLFVWGDATKNMELMCQTGPDCISIDANIDIQAAKQITDRYNITIAGTIPLTTVMLLGSQPDNMRFVVNLLDQLGPRNLIVSPGCDMPYDVPVENAIGIYEALHNTDTVRNMLAHYEAVDTFAIDVTLPDYAHLDRPLIEVFTLDSDTCPACMYMRDAAVRSVHGLDSQVDLVEYKFTERENVARCKKLGVKNLPSIYINGELKFSSIIPSTEELLAEIHKAL